MKVDHYIVNWRYDKNFFNSIVTTCLIKDLNTNRIIKGVAFKHPKDNHNKHIARRLSLSRALQLLNLDKEGRRKFWQVYLESCKIGGKK